MRKIVVINQKGGVGKTTTVVNLAAGLVKQGKKVLIIDLDPQGNVSTCLGTKSPKDIHDVLINQCDPSICIAKAKEGIDVIPSRETLTKAEMILAGEQSRETILKRALREIKGYDFVFLDCAPSLGLLNQNAILYANEIFIPASTDVLALTGLRNMMKAIEKINDVFSHNASISTIIPTMFDQRNKICKDVLAKMKEEYPEQLTEPIRVNSKLKESPASGTSIFSYDGSCRGAKDYLSLVNAVLGKKQLEKPMTIQARIKPESPVRTIVRRSLS